MFVLLPHSLGFRSFSPSKQMSNHEYDFKESGLIRRTVSRMVIRLRGLILLIKGYSFTNVQRDVQIYRGQKKKKKIIPEKKNCSNAAPYFFLIDTNWQLKSFLTGCSNSAPPACGRNKPTVAELIPNSAENNFGDFQTSYVTSFIFLKIFFLF